MAGIGFELRKILKRDSLTGVAQAYGYAGVISSGPWILSILGILLLGFMTISDVTPSLFVSQFQTSVTYLISVSLIFSGLLQHGFTRYIADRIYEHRDERILPNFNGALLLTTVISGIFGFLVIFFFMSEQSISYRLLMNAGFVVLCNIWVTTNLLSGLKAYKTIVAVFAIAYTVVIVVGYTLRGYGLEGLLFGFVVGHIILLLGMLVSIYRGYPASYPIEFDFMKPGRMYPSLILAGLLYNLGVWIDKFIFWFTPATGSPIIGPLHASLIYDLPIFLAYLSIIPGMAVFLVRMETDFAEYYDKFFKAVISSKTLFDIRELRNEMVLVAKQGIFEIIKIQSIAVLLTFVAGPYLLRFLGISDIYLHLLYVDVIGASLQVVFLGILNVLFYLDKHDKSMLLTGLFVVSNAILTTLSIYLGPFFFGYGFAVALLICCAVGMAALDHDFEDLEYVTFMLQKST